MKKALLFGASGFVGSCLLQELLQSAEYEQVIAITRNELKVKDPKLKNLLADQASLGGLKDELKADDLFISIGTTKKKTPDLHEYYAIDHDYPVLAASLGKEAGVTSLFFVSAVGANPKSKVFYSRTKGEAERDLLALDFLHTHIFRPSIIMGERPESRPMEKAFIGACKVLNPLLLGSWKRYRGISAQDIAKAMLRAANQPAEKVKIYEWPDMEALL